MTTTLNTETTTGETPVEKVADKDRFQTLRGFGKGLSFGLMIISVGLLLAAFLVPRLIGAVPLTVLSGSMVPTFNPGDLIVTLPVDADTIKRGDVVTFQPVSGESSLITHRVLSVGFSLNGDTLFITKGDANGAEDEPIIGEQIMGKYIYHIPYLGFLANAIPSDNKAFIMQVLGVAFFAWAGLQVVLAIFGGRRGRKGARGRRAKPTTGTGTTEAAPTTPENDVEVDHASH